MRGLLGGHFDSYQSASKEKRGFICEFLGLVNRSTYDYENTFLLAKGDKLKRLHNTGGSYTCYELDLKEMQIPTSGKVISAPTIVGKQICTDVSFNSIEQYISGDSKTYYKMNFDTLVGTRLIDPPVSSSSKAHIYYNGHFYMFGTSGLKFITVQKYNTNTNTWTSLPDIPISVFSYISYACKVDNLVYIFVGDSTSATKTVVFTYNLDNDTFTEVVTIEGYDFVTNVKPEVYATTCRYSNGEIIFFEPYIIKTYNIANKTMKQHTTLGYGVNTFVDREDAIYSTVRENLVFNKYTTF